MMEHVERLLENDQLRVDTTRGRRLVTAVYRSVEHGDHAVELKRLMAEMGKPDRELQARMPVGAWMEVTLSVGKWFFFREVIGRLQVVCLSPIRDLLMGEAPAPVTLGDVQKVLTELTMANRGSDIPTTVVIVSTSGFAPEASDLAERRADRTLILVQPNDTGGWKVTGPTETKALVDLFDPEPDVQKRLRVRRFLEENHVELLSSGLAADKIAAKLELPLQLVEAELKSYASTRPGLAAKRLDGRIVLFSEGVSGAGEPAAASGDSSMGIISRIKALFSRNGNEGNKIAVLSERRAALTQQQDRIYEELSKLETLEASLREQFKQSTSALAKRRMTAQLLQLRKDIERRQQMLQMIGQQVNVVSTHLHNLELVRQGQGASLPTSEEMGEDAARAEEMLAQLQADSEVAGTVGGAAVAGMSEEEQALFDELEREGAQEKQAAAGAAATTPPVTTPPVRTTTPRTANTPTAEPAELEEEPSANEPPPVPTDRSSSRAKPEPG